LIALKIKVTPKWSSNRELRKIPTHVGRRDRENKNKKRFEWNGVRAIARDRESWKAVFKPSTPSGRSE